MDQSFRPFKTCPAILLHYFNKAIKIFIEGRLNMKITDDARDILLQMFEDKNVKNIRVYFDGFG